jgi:hypothetical protein
MNVLEQVHDFIVARPREPVCDKCIAERLGLSIPNHANHKTRELAKTKSFHRAKGTCSTCGKSKLVIQNA